MNILERIEEFFIKRNLKRRLIKSYPPFISDSRFHKKEQFRKVLNTLRENKVMVDTREDGIWIRLAGSGEDYINSDYFVKIVDFRDDKLKKLGI